MADRREFFRSLACPVREEAPKETAILRPPYAGDLSLFQSRCPTCETHACATACEEEIIVIRADRTPTLNLTEKGCIFCEACAEACEAGVLNLSDGPERVNAFFRIDPKACLAHHDTICFACKEPCIDDAILFNGLYNPVIDEERCTGCGFCMSRCPTQAIDYRVLG
ncbi:4Fe-4S binding protein [Nitratifractor salsuginis]|uniref:Periplasmic nitrate reductase, ferredoxin-type protein NapF n=1 Tax=Nitratifractor salsuginis (strain DSM 16511 / JCM 12458 / E9I37-1) TaxID=749222 RepID=E6X0K2_NITSE|nr:4Fe-4S binding protein [Nitratifractor salsuginis]ADV46852.1 periplasmic nitrate reductase, ferredoxin-type protein NapF [Nitratifractor salsuginis DSM 16511]